LHLIPLLPESSERATGIWAKFPWLAEHAAYLRQESKRLQAAIAVCDAHLDAQAFSASLSDLKTIHLAVQALQSEKTAVQTDLVKFTDAIRSLALENSLRATGGMCITLYYTLLSSCMHALPSALQHHNCATLVRTASANTLMDDKRSYCSHVPFF
jgi:hypothetical protein